MSLRRRLLAFITLLLGASLMGGGVLTYMSGDHRVDQEMSSALTVGENALRDALLPMLSGPIKEEQLQRVISSFNGDRHLRARLIDASGAVQAESQVRRATYPAPNWLKDAMAGPEQSAELALPQGLGKIQLVADPLNEISEIWEDAKLKLAIVGGFCLLVLGMISVTLGRALKPLEGLSAALQQVGRGDYQAHVSETGPEELSAIYRGFNVMAAKLSEAELKNRQLNEQLATIQDEERAEIARDLHDEVGPFLFAVDVDAQTIPKLIEKNATDAVTQRTQAIRQSVGHMQTHLRSVLQRLQPALLLDLGVAHAAEQLAEFWKARYPSITFDIACSDESFGKKTDEAVFRVLQEGASNAVRHGKPSRIRLATERLPGGMVEVSVSDDGTGMPDEPRKGFGLAGMRDRIALIGGRLTVSTGPNGKGVTLHARIPAEGPIEHANSFKAAEEKI